jgi:hypothetical protein
MLGLVGEPEVRSLHRPFHEAENGHKKTRTVENPLQNSATYGRIIAMRKIIVLSFITLDGVMQGPGGPTEDTSGNFTSGGWTVPYFDDVLDKTMEEQMSQPFDLLLGRKNLSYLHHIGHIMTMKELASTKQQSMLLPIRLLAMSGVSRSF